MPKDNKAKKPVEFKIDLSKLDIPDWKNGTIDGIKVTEYLEKLKKEHADKSKGNKEKK